MPLNLNEIEMIDFHSHFVDKTLLSEMVFNRASYHLDFLGITNMQTRTRLLKQRQSENFLSPHYRIIIKYIALRYGCKPTLEEVDQVLRRNYEENFSNYVRSIMDRENIKLVQLAEPSPDFGEFPTERSRWAFRCDLAIQPEWARDEGAQTIDQAVELVEQKLRWATKEGCSGIKTCIAYYRGLDMRLVTSETASRAFKELKDKKAQSYRPHYGLFSYPIYEKQEYEDNWKAYEDYIIRHIMIRCGELGLSFHCHTGGGVAPSMDLRKVNPALMYSLFYDEEIANAGTNIVLLHCGVPYIGEAAAAASQFPHVYVDTSWPTRTDTIRDIFRICLREVSPMKILYGSDSSFIAERMGVGAWIARKMLSEVLEDQRRLEWSEDDCLEAARLIFNGNAKRLMKTNL